MKKSLLHEYKVYTALVTPLDANGGVDLDTMTDLLDRQESAGNGVVVLGSTGEGAAMRLAHKETLLRHVSARSLNVPVLVGASGMNIEGVLSWIAFCEKQRIDGYLMSVPPYVKPNDQGQYTWFKTLMRATRRPCMLYNVPGRSAMPLSYEAVSALGKEKNCWGLKEASGKLDTGRAYAKVLADEKGYLYSGEDRCIHEWMQEESVTGLVSVMSNAWPEAVKQYVTQAQTKTLTDADIQRWLDVCNALEGASNPIPIKHMLHALKLIKTPKVYIPLSDQDLDDKRKKGLLAAHETMMALGESIGSGNELRL